MHCAQCVPPLNRIQVGNSDRDSGIHCNPVEKEKDNRTNLSLKQCQQFQGFLHPE